jgi:hypothetical protein
MKTIYLTLAQEKLDKDALKLYTAPRTGPRSTPLTSARSGTLTFRTASDVDGFRKEYKR